MIELSKVMVDKEGGVVESVAEMLDRLPDGIGLTSREVAQIVGVANPTISGWAHILRARGYVVSGYLHEGKRKNIFASRKTVSDMASSTETTEPELPQAEAL